MRDALEKSLNVATVRLAREVGTERIVDVARRLGIESPLDPVPALALGAADVTPLELARAYATLANGGERPTVRFFEDLSDALGPHARAQRGASERVLDAGTSYLAVSLLEGVVDRGTAHAVRDAGITGPVAGKTGTSDDSKDAWFVGFTPELVAVVWVGFDEPRDMKLPAAQLAVPIWLRFLKRRHRRRGAGRVRAAGVRAPRRDRSDERRRRARGLSASRVGVLRRGHRAARDLPRGRLARANGERARPGDATRDARGDATARRLARSPLRSLVLSDVARSPARR